MLLSRYLSTSKKLVVDQYTHGHAAPVVQAHALRTAEAFAPAAIKLMRLGDSVLDVGCGPGSITSGFKKYVGASGRVVGLDVEEKILDEARKRLGADGEIVHGSVYDLPFPSKSFDVVHAHQVLQHLKDPVAALREMRRVSRAMVVCREVDYESWLWHPEIESSGEQAMQHWKRAYRETCRKNGANPDAGRMLKAWFREAGLDNLQLSSSTVQYADALATAQFGETWAKRVAETQLGEQMEQYGLAKRDEVQAMARAWREWGQHPDAYLFYVDVCAVARV